MRDLWGCSSLSWAMRLLELRGHLFSLTCCAMRIGRGWEFAPNSSGSNFPRLDGGNNQFFIVPPISRLYVLVYPLWQEKFAKFILFNLDNCDNLFYYVCNAKHHFLSQTYGVRVWRKATRRPFSPWCSIQAGNSGTVPPLGKGGHCSFTAGETFNDNKGHTFRISDIRIPYN